MSTKGINNILFGRLHCVRHVDDLPRDMHVLRSLQSVCCPAGISLEVDCAPGKIMRALECSVVVLNKSQGLKVLTANTKQKSTMSMDTMHFRIPRTGTCTATQYARDFRYVWNGMLSHLCRLAQQEVRVHLHWGCCHACLES